MSKIVATISLAATLVWLSGCALFMGPGHDQTSRVNVTQSALRYLYPEDTIDTMAPASVTRLDLPLRVGVAFIPASGATHRSPVQEAALQKLATRMSEKDFVSSAVVLPPGSLSHSGGFTELQRLAYLHRIEAVVLLSYEQVVYTEDSALSLLDLTVLGAFVVPGHKNEVQTQMVATAVHIQSERYLFSATATHTQERQATLIHTPTQIRESQNESLTAAAEQLAPRLEAAVTAFKFTLENDHSLQVAGGSMSWILLLLLAVCMYGMRQH